MTQKLILIKTIKSLKEIFATGLSTSTISWFIRFFRIPSMQIFVSDLIDREHCAGGEMAALELLPRVNIYKPANLVLIFMENTNKKSRVYFLPLQKNIFNREFGQYIQVKWDVCTVFYCIIGNPSTKIKRSTIEEITDFESFL